MAYLIDTSVFGRLANSADILHATAERSLLKLHRQGEIIHITAQNLIEFRNMATRPSVQNGLGLTTAEAEAKASAFQSYFPLLEETKDIFPA
jgi:predicted nucleic acid-binding protein